jgi:TolB-like protein
MSRTTALLIASAALASALAVATPSAAQDRIRIALLPMVVHSAEPPGYLRRGLSDMIASRMERVPDLDVVRIDNSKASTTNLAKALETAREAKAEFVLFGSFTRFGTGASLDVQCAGTGQGGEEPLREIFVHSGSIGDVIPDLDDLVGKVARFIVADYTERIAARSGGGNADLPSTRATKQLEDRIAALERDLKALADQMQPQAATGADPAAGDVAGAP